MYLSIYCLERFGDMKITKKQLEKLVESIVEEQTDLGQKQSQENVAMQSIEQLRQKYGKLMSKMNASQQNALLQYFTRVLTSGAANGSSTRPGEEHFLRFFAYLHGGPKP